ncbi:FAD-binding oxidoreductase, partial [bacterium]|nr:FAD-binding oxidoreductase [bacterium]
MAKPKYIPPWYEGRVPGGTYRSLFKWGDPGLTKHPNSGLVKLMLDTFQMGCDELIVPGDLGLDKVDVDVPIMMDQLTLDFFIATCGAENVHMDTYTRIDRSYGGGMIDALRLRQHIVENLPAAVLAPRTRADVEASMRYCDEQRIPLYVYGGGSTVTRGFEAVKGGVCLDLSRHFNQVIDFNETDQTITVQPGMWGPELERILNDAPRTLGARGSYTCGHFPQSFMHSSVGGWVVTRGAGQNSTYYGKIEDMVIAQEYVTPRGLLQT